MDEKYYYTFLSNYRKGMEFVLTTDRGNGPIPQEVFLDYLPDEKGELKPFLRFMEGRAIFDPEAIGGFEKILGLKESPEMI
jgi:hypothetical protein